MSLSHTIARPYAQAIFELAQENKTIQHWKDMLIFINKIVKHEKIKNFLLGAVSPKYVSSFLIIVCKKKIDVYGSNLIKILAQNQRLNLLEDILNHLCILEMNYQKILSVKLISSCTLPKENIDSIQNILEKIFFKKILLLHTIDKKIIGGFILKIHDQVFNFSFSFRLKQLSYFLQS